ncbi:hypothetical protein RHMOL_Rhmol03G0208000 [Rhododendron molle]|uniref:Uncharacterized protein n=1 Tax=Rhododendron molle TaxID=49168 RepID=A0ACC0PGD6_RHOML|nr:hypothetical protein RHMOL_Rhmol03G0208000 [Rhododendron molle]
MKKNSTTAPVAVILRDWKGRSLIDDFPKSIQVASIRYACVPAKGRNLLSIEIQGDNKEVIIHLCVSEDDPPWECAVFPISEQWRWNLSYISLRVQGKLIKLQIG